LLDGLQTVLIIGLFASPLACLVALAAAVSAIFLRAGIRAKVALCAVNAMGIASAGFFVLVLFFPPGPINPG
jgi:hypothetical protein